MPQKNKLPEVPSRSGNRRWRFWQVESSLACNIACVMCPWHKARLDLSSKGLMSPLIWDSLRPFLGGVSSIDFSGGGEPLLQPALFSWLRQAKFHGCRTGFLTNGLLLDFQATQRVLDCEMDWLAFSLDGATPEIYESIRRGSDFTRVTSNIYRLASLRANTRPLLVMQLVMMQSNWRQLEDFVRLGAELGVDLINFKNCDVERTDGDASLADLRLFGLQGRRGARPYEKALARALRLARKLKIKTTAYGFNPDELPVCDMDPRDSLFISYDGRLAPCISLAYGGPSRFMGKAVSFPTLSFGKLPQDDLEELWQQSPEWLDFRNKLDQRATIYDRTLASGDLAEPSLIKLNNLLQKAAAAMPPPPSGCGTCHYLFGV